MDDFGTGYSSLGYLWRYGFDKIKIDRSFVVGLDQDAVRSTEIIDTIIVLAHRLEMNVTVEGIETKEQARIVSRLGCDHMQGYLFSRPMAGGRSRRLHPPQCRRSRCGTPGSHQCSPIGAGRLT